MTNDDYLHNHEALRQLWLNQKRVYSYLSPRQQWDLHHFFRPADELNRDDLLAHRQAITTAEPALPQRAGRALKALRQLPSTWQPAVQHAPTSRANGTRLQRVRVSGLVRPTIDEDKLALAFIMLAKSLGERKKDKTPDDSEDVRPGLT